MAQEEGIVCSISENGWAQVITQRKESCAHILKKSTPEKLFAIDNMRVGF